MLLFPRADDAPLQLSSKLLKLRWPEPPPTRWYLKTASSAVSPGMIMLMCIHNSKSFGAARADLSYSVCCRYASHTIPAITADIASHVYITLLLVDGCVAFWPRWRMM